MHESMNVEAAHQVHEHGAHGADGSRSGHALEIIEAILLAVVAIATAWSGYQAALWEGKEAEQYSLATKYHVQSSQEANLGGQQRLLDQATFNQWIVAERGGDEELAQLYVRRFSDEYRVAFDAWLAMDPLHDPDAPPGPAYTDAYHNHLMDESLELERKGDETFYAAAEARHHADDYVKLMVLLATVLFLVVMSQRFRLHGIKIGMMVFAGVLVATALYSLLTFPRM